MSHFTQVKTQLKESTVLKRALARLGYAVVEGEEGQQVRGFMGDTQAAEFKIRTSTHYDIGFARDAQGGYALVGDWELLPKVSGIVQAEFLKNIKREYARETILEQAAARGYEVQTEEKDGVLELVVVQS